MAFRLRSEMINRRRFQPQTTDITETYEAVNPLLAGDTSRIVRPLASVTEKSTELLEPVTPKQTQNF